MEIYQRHRGRCGRKRACLLRKEVRYIRQRVDKGGIPDTIVDRKGQTISCSMRTLSRMFARNQYNFSVKHLLMKEKRHPNGYIERQGKTGQLGRSIYQQYQDFPHYQHEFGHLEADTVQREAHQGTVMTLVELQSKVITVPNVHDKLAESIN